MVLDDNATLLLFGEILAFAVRPPAAHEARVKGTRGRKGALPAVYPKTSGSLARMDSRTRQKLPDICNGVSFLLPKPYLTQRYKHEENFRIRG